jgi:hypothetical protein
MLCWSCRKEIPDTAKRCQYCEAAVEPEPSEEDIDAVEGLLDNMSPDVMSELQAVFEESESGEDFVNRIMVGQCPACGSANTSDCGDDPEIDDVDIGRCVDCGQLWCIVCDLPLREDQLECPQCGMQGDLDELSQAGQPELNRYHLLACEIFGYSFANYQDHLGIGNVRFDRLMPQDAEVLERAHREKWPPSKVRDALSVDLETAEQLLAVCEQAIQVIDAENPAESFRNAVRFVIERALTEGLENDDSIEDLVTQICYRASDLAVLLDMEGQPLSRYSRHLRRERGVGYHEGYFD